MAVVISIAACIAAATIVAASADCDALCGTSNSPKDVEQAVGA